MKITIKDLERRIIGLFDEKDYSQSAVQSIADYLIWAEMSGIGTQGAIKLAGKEPLQDIKPLYEPKIERDTKLSQLIDGGANPAPYVSSFATDVVIEKAKASGFAIVGTRNTFSSNGAQAYYVEKIAAEGLIGIMCSRSPASTTGFGSIEPLFGTNPFGCGFPTNGEPLVFDMATSAMTFYGLILAKARGEKIPDNMAIDSDGNLTNDPAEAMEGAILPFDRGYKSATLSMMVEILSGALTNSAWVDNKTFEEEWGSLFIAIDPNLLIDLEAFKNNTSDLVAKVKASKGGAGVSEIRLPGERSLAKRREAIAAGYVEIDDVVARDIGLL